MTAQQTHDLTRAIELIERPLPPPRMPAASMPIRLKTSMWLRRLMPTRLVVARAARRGARLWQDSPAERQDALAAMRTVVGGTPQEQDLTEIARAHLIERQADRALFWQPWRTPGTDPQSAQRLRGSLAHGRGVLLSACHAGPFFLTSTALRPIGCAPFVVSGSWFFEEPTHDYWGRRLARWRKGTHIPLVPAEGSFPILTALLERGESVLLYLDMPGRRETRFLGKPAELADGIARLAMQTDALVVPIRLRREGHRTRLDVAAPMDSRDFDGVEELHVSVARQHERWILEFPARMEDPRRFGWQDGASEHAWVAPRPQDRSG
jgi:lauroyl/myristoyl acyltransferase